MAQLDLYSEKMRKKLNRLAEGIVEYERPQLVLSDESLEISIGIDEKYEGTLEIDVPSGESISGYAFSDNPRMKLSKENFAGFHDSIDYVFDSTGYEQGNVIKGYIFLLCDAGEYKVRFTVSIPYSERKEKIETVTEKKESFYSVCSDCQTEGYFDIVTEEKGTCNIKISCEGEWEDISVETENASLLLLEREIIKAEEIEKEAKEITFSLMVNESAMHDGINYSSICFKFNNSVRKYPVRIRKSRRMEESFSNIVKYHRYIEGLFQNYIELRIGVSELYNFAAKERAIVALIQALGDRDEECRLFKTHIYILEGDKKKAAEELFGVEEKLDALSELYYGYYLFLSCMISEDKDEIKQKSVMLHQLYTDNRKENLLLWMLILVEEDLRSSQENKLFMMKKQMEIGGASPLLCLEAYSIYESDKQLLTVLEQFELQVMWYAVDTGLVDSGMADIIAEAAMKEKSMSPLLYRLLERLYEELGCLKAVTVICTQYILLEREDEQAFRWYSIAVNHHLNITKLYESFVGALPEDYAMELPEEIQLFFTYGMNLKEDKRAAFYANIIRYHEKIDGILDKYESQFLDFAVTMAGKGEMSPALSVIYDYMMDREAFSKVFEQKLSTIIFTHMVTIRDKEAAFVEVCEEAFSETVRYPVASSRASVVVYGKSYEMNLRRKDGTIIEKPNFYEEALFEPMEYEEQLYDLPEKNVGISLFLAENNRRCKLVDEDNYSYVLALLESPQVSENYKAEYRLLMLEYLMEKGEKPDLQAALNGLKPELLGRKERELVFRYLLAQRAYDKARRVLLMQGISEVDSILLLSFVRLALEDETRKNDELIYYICCRLFNEGYHDEIIVGCLLTVKRGTARFLRSVWKCAKEMGMDTRELEDALLVQMLYTGAFVGEREQIFESYAHKGAAPKLEIAWLTNDAFEYMVHGAVMEESFFGYLSAMAKREKKINDLCSIALVSYFALKGRKDRFWNEAMEKMIREIIRGFLSRRIVLRDFMQFKDLVSELSLFEGCVFVEHYAKPGTVVTIHYRIKDGSRGGRDDLFIVENMRNYIAGIYAKNIVLFRGERLEYYITCDNNGEVYTTESTMCDGGQNAKPSLYSRHGLIDEMYRSRNMAEHEKLFILMEGYCLREHMNDRLFEPIE